jgi:putative flippase GtrA
MPAYDWLLLPVLVAGLLVNGGLQVLSCRLGRGWISSFFAGFAAGLAATVAGVLWLTVPAGLAGIETLALVASAALAYGACGFFYFNIVNGRKSALRVRLLRELRESPAGLSAAEVLERYRPDEMFTTRLGRMVAHRQALEVRGRLHVRHGAVWMIMRAMTALKLLIFGARSEFERTDRAASERRCPNSFGEFLARLPLRQFLTFLAVGGVATLWDWVVFYLLAVRFGWHHQPAVAVSLISSGVVHFSLNKLLTFRCASRRVLRQVAVFALTSVAYTLLSMGCMYLLIDLAGLPKMGGKMVTTGAMLVVNFLLQKFVTFNRRLFPQEE